jgi:outer membrane lipoprotein LolB
LRWKQKGQIYLLQVSGPGGQGAARLEGNDNGVTLTRSDRTIYHASNPEELLTTHLGWQVPVRGLHYWIRGLPTPSSKSDSLALDAAGRLIRLHQDDWDIHFDRYSSTDLLELPGRLVLEHPSITVRIIVERWRLN